jgi:hypothetical protein
MRIGDIVEYRNRKWYLYDLYGDNLCHIVLIRNGKHTKLKHFKQGNYEWDEEYLNANIVNVNINEIKITN